MTDRALLLTPSRGLGGGIERYVETLEWAFAAQGVEYRRIDLSRSGPAAHVRLLAQCRAELGRSSARTRLVLAHRTLLPVAWLLARERCVDGISVVCHGSDVWGTGHRARRAVEDYLLRWPRVRVVAVSSYTAGAISVRGPATVLPPGLSQQWFDMLVDASMRPAQLGAGINLITAFRLADWQDKGLPQLLGAVTALGRSDVQVSVCGSGTPPPGLQQLVCQHGFCTIRPGLTDWELARELAAADLLVLATRTRPGRHAAGEGFGLVLLEAQVAGTPVVGPAYGGSHDAFIDRVTGVAPTDESTGALAEVLGELLQDQQQLAQMGKRAAEWARECFAPERYASRAVARLM